MDGERLSSSAGEPSDAAETSCVRGWQADAAPMQVSRTKTCAWSFSTAEKATKRPSTQTAGVSSDTPCEDAEDEDALAEAGQTPDPTANGIALLEPPPLPTLPGRFGTGGEGGLNTVMLPHPFKATMDGGMTV